MSRTELESQDTYAGNVGKKKKSKKIKNIIITVANILLIAIVVFVIFICIGTGEMTSENYSSNLNTAASEMLGGAEKAEECGNLILKVWFNAINEKYDLETDEFTNPDGYFVSFDDALSNLYSDLSFSEEMDEIKVNQDDVEALMKNLQNPSGEYKEAYEAVSEMYDAYANFVSMVIDPTGSYDTYSSAFNDANSEFMGCYNSAKIYLNE